MKKRILAAIAGATALTTAPAIGADDTHFGPDTFANLAEVFNATDFDGNDRLAPAEYRALRLNTVDDRWVSRYSGASDTALTEAANQSFALLDADDDGAISPSEFMNLVEADPEAANNYVVAWDADPEYMTLTYYLSANRIPTDELIGDPVANLEGDRVGTIEAVIRHDDTSRYYAVIDVVGTDMDLHPAVVPNERVGVPLSDILFFDEGRSLMLSTRGEDYLRNTDNALELDYTETVDYVDYVTLYG